MGWADWGLRWLWDCQCGRLRFSAQTRPRTLEDARTRARTCAPARARACGSESPVVSLARGRGQLVERLRELAELRATQCRIHEGADPAPPPDTGAICFLHAEGRGSGACAGAEDRRLRRSRQREGAAEWRRPPQLDGASGPVQSLLVRLTVEEPRAEPDEVVAQLVRDAVRRELPILTVEARTSSTAMEQAANVAAWLQDLDRKDSSAEASRRLVAWLLVRSQQSGSEAGG